MVPAEYGRPVEGLMGMGVFLRLLRTTLEGAGMGSFDDFIPVMPKKKRIAAKRWIKETIST
jgi:hypothetical protein